MNFRGSNNIKRISCIILIILISVLPLSACKSQNSGKNTAASSTKAKTAITNSKITSTSSSAKKAAAAETGSTDSSSNSVSGNTNTESSSSDVINTNVSQGISGSDIAVQYDKDDVDSSWSSSEASHIILKGDSISFTGSGATVDGNKITVSAAGTYSITGTLSDGQIIVDTGDDEAVKIVLNGADISCSYSAPIYVHKAEKVIITLADGTNNHIKDGDNYVITDTEKGEPDGTLFSKSDLTFNGSGSLTVDANYKDGIVSKDGLKIIGGNITVNAADDGIRGRDYVAVKDSNITVNAQGDGIKSNNDEDTQKGFVTVDGDNINIVSGRDGIQAETSILINDGYIKISSGGGSANSLIKNLNNDGMMRNGRGFVNDTNDDSGSYKGIKAKADVVIKGGTINVDSADDALHSNRDLAIDGGNISIASGDDGIHSDSTLNINNGDINITKSFEGAESGNITVNGGNIHIVSSDDGFNIAGGNDSSSINGRPGQNRFAALSNNYLNINGGYIVINANGDGLDSNGSINMTGGTVIVNGPTSNNNGALDYDGSFKMTGGFLVAVGSSGMAQAPDTSSTQNSVMINLSSVMSGGTMIHVESDKGQDILTFKPEKNYQSVLISSPQLVKGSTYNVYYGGSSTGMAKDGIYSGGTYTQGTKFDSFTISSVVTYVGTGIRGNMGGNMGGKGFRQ